MIRTALKVFVADVVLLMAVFYVLQDLQWRSNYAASPHAVCLQVCSYAPSFSYGILTQVFTMAGNGVRLSSPPTLDWVQAIVYVLVVINAWFAYVLLKSRRSGQAKTTVAPVA